MATPTPVGKHPTGLGAGVTPPVSTPFSASRSVNLSPQQYKKSPANSNQYAHPTASSFGGINFDSPTTAAALATLPLGDLGLDASAGGLGGGLGHLGGGLGLAGGLGGGLGGLQGIGRLDEDERKRRKLMQIVDTLKAVKGRVSEDGIERLARSVGLECLWETGMGRGGKSKTLIIAGTGLSIDIEFTDNVVETVTLGFPESPESVTRHADEAGKILLDDLKLGKGETVLTKRVDRFAGNLDRMARLDKLSVMPQLNCHEAVTGIYDSLEKLHKWEVARLTEEEAMSGKTQEQIVRAALLKKSGRPAMNAHGSVGLCLEYWQERHATSQGEGCKTWSLLLECDQSSSMVYPPVRVSSAWISPSVVKSNPTADDVLLSASDVVLDWQDPPNILLPSDPDQKDDSGMEGIEQSGQLPNQKFPDVRFVAKFSPPLTLPYSAAMQIYDSTGAHLEPDALAAFDALAFPPQTTEPSEPDGAHRRIRKEQLVSVYKRTGEHEKQCHTNTLTIPKMEYALKLTEVPFSHPRELVQMLPILRQYTRLSTLLERSFGSKYTSDHKTESEDVPGEESTVKDDFDAFMAEASHKNKKLQFTKIPVDVSLYTQPGPSLRIIFPLGPRIADILVEIESNGALHVVSQNVIPEGDGMTETTKTKSLTVDDLGRILETCEDIGIFAEFLRQRLG
ncbi:hypothetical protein V500_07886 [Pseudogymnoascus sp. VKM F-4518 (FW-2643)]|nr:hypothetical protein V500_07886 [Pseudogymnoascus sp. VKM F-4518 (FW-2643)]